MTTTSGNSVLEKNQTPVFEIPLDLLSYSRFENWGQSVENTDSVSVFVGGLDGFVGDDSNRILRCLTDAQQLFSVGKKNADGDPTEWENLSPLVLFGETGTGKTSLALSLIMRICSESTNLSNGLVADNRPVCLAGSEFFRRYVAAMDRQSITEFRQRLLDAPGVLIDNVGQLEGKPSAQRELVYLIDQFNRLGKPVVITMQCSPVEANHLAPHLLSRLCGGVALPVQPPGIEARREIIARLARMHRITLDPEAAEWIASRMSVSVPKLNHFFVQLKTELNALNDPNLANKPVDMATLGLVFQLDENTIDTMANRIIEAVADEFDLSISVLCSNSRKQTVVMARGVAIWLLRKMLRISYHAIGTRFGNRDHTTILHAFQKYDALIETEHYHGESTSLGNLVGTLQLRLNDSFAGQMTLVP